MLPLDRGMSFKIRHIRRSLMCVIPSPSKGWGWGWWGWRSPRRAQWGRRWRASGCRWRRGSQCATGCSGVAAGGEEWVIDKIYVKYLMAGMAGGRYKAKGTTDSEIAFCTIGFVWRGKVIMLINVCEKRGEEEVWEALPHKSSHFGDKSGPFSFFERGRVWDHHAL